MLLESAIADAFGLCVGSSADKMRGIVTGKAAGLEGTFREHFTFHTLQAEANASLVWRKLGGES